MKRITLCLICILLSGCEKPDITEYPIETAPDRFVDIVKKHIYPEYQDNEMSEKVFMMQTDEYSQLFDDNHYYVGFLLDNEITICVMNNNQAYTMSGKYNPGGSKLDLRLVSVVNYGLWQDISPIHYFNEFLLKELKEENK